MKDGFAVISSDGIGEYKVVNDIMAGGTIDLNMEKGQIMRITTGAAIPSGADAVVMVERTSTISKEPEIIKIYDVVVPGQDVRAIGSDVSIGQTILTKGRQSILWNPISIYKYLMTTHFIYDIYLIYY